MLEIRKQATCCILPFEAYGDDATEADKDGLLQVVEERFLHCPDVEVDSFMQETILGDAVLFKRARSILNDHALRDWFSL